jgi:hypothetical protein
MTEVAEWDLTDATDEDIAFIEQEHPNALKGMMVASIRTNAAYSRIEDEGTVTQKWVLDARIVMRDEDEQYSAVTFHADVPFRSMTIEEARDRWTGIVAHYFVQDWLPVYLAGGFDDEIE